MSYIEQAQTPTLIQHGEFDRRVPIPNAYELRQGLEDRGVPVEMIVYKGFGHGISKPRSIRAVMRHNLEWFNHYLLGDRAPDFFGPDLPAQQDDKEEENPPGKTETGGQSKVASGSTPRNRLRPLGTGTTQRSRT